MKRSLTVSVLGLLTTYAAAAAPARHQSAEPAAALAGDAEVLRPVASGPELELLAGLAGEYLLTARFWPDPGAEAIVSQLPARRSLILGGRVLRLEVGPDAGGFRGTGLMGYDGRERRFWYVWTDTSSAGVAFLEGSLDRGGTGHFEGTRPTPGGRTSLRVEVRRRGRSEVHDYLVPGRDGMARYLELRYEPSREPLTRNEP